MPCGCITTCGCNLSLGAGLLGSKVGDTLVIGLNLLTSDCISLGYSAGKLVADIIVDPASTSVSLTCGVSGLSGSVNVTDGNTVNLDTSGGTLTAEVIVDPADTPVQLSSSASGLKADLDIVDGATVNLDTSGGFLTAEIILDPASTGATVGPNGLLVTGGGGGGGGPTVGYSDLTTQVQEMLVMPGMMIDYAGATAPSGWLIADGSAISRTTYADLFAAIGTTHGPGDGSTTFNIPDARTRVSVGKHTSGTFSVLGAKAGVESANLAINELPAHTHAVSGTAADHTHSAGTLKFSLINGGAGGGSGNTAVMATSTGFGVGAMSGNTGGSNSGALAVSGSAATISGYTGQTALSKLQPYIVLNKLIKT